MPQALALGLSEWDGGVQWGGWGSGCCEPAPQKGSILWQVFVWSREEGSRCQRISGSLFLGSSSSRGIRCGQGVGISP